MDQELLNSSLFDYANCSTENETELLYFNLSSVDQAVLSLHASFISLVIIASVTGNSLVLLLVLKDKRLRYRSVLASLNVSAIDFLMSIFYHGVILSNTLTKRWSYGEDNDTLCIIYGASSTYIVYVRWIAIGFMTTDRFLSVKFPFKYKTSYTFLLLGTLAVWFIPLILVMLPLYLQSSSFRANIPTCIPTCINVDNPIYCRLLYTLTLTTVFAVGGALPTIMYVWMYCKAKRLNTMHSLGKASLQLTTIGNITSQMNSFFEERRAMITVFLIFLTVSVTSLPSYLFILLRQLNVCIFFKIPIVVHFMVTDLFLVSTALDPIILMRTHDFRVALKGLITKKPKCHVSEISSTQTNETSSRKVSTDTTSL